MKALFVVGTDTGVGKTMVAGCLAKYLKEKGAKVITQKWIQTGSGPKSFRDIDFHFKMMGYKMAKLKKYLPFIEPYVFKTSSSPHLAAKIEKRRINESVIIKSFKALSKEFDFIIIEGTGGALVPFNNKELIINIVKKLNLPVLVVSQNKLGAINHTLLTLEALKIRKIKNLGIIFSNLKGQNKRIIIDNPVIIKKLTGQRILGVLPWVKPAQELYNEFIPIAGKIMKGLG